MMTKRSMLILAFATAACAAPVAAQGHAAHGAHGDEIAAVREVVHTLFRGMQTGDSAMVRSVFHPEVRMATSFRDREGHPQVRVEAGVDGFVEAVGTPHDEVWDERISNLEIKVDADLAIAWMNYSFFLGDRFSHCGVNVMELVRTSAGWKILNLADTRRREGCAES